MAEEKTHDVDYSDPAEESKGNWEKKVNFITISKLTYLIRLSYQRLQKLLEKSKRNASSRSEQSSTEREMIK